MSSTAIGEFTITLLLSNDLGCTDTLARQLCVENRIVMFVPNVFSPNDNGNNDVLKVEAIGLGEILWSVFNRFGEKVFEASTVDAVWDGTFNGRLLDPEVFVVHVRYTDQATGQSGQQVSAVTLIR